ncbi:HlyD family type I secretion periplasmic adaptor subunit [Methylobacterium oxalidis]|uniref:Membrane fusion protein (MFP) family protein n=1 Tax=Methylobacterium oxalidis TaxID=944322 RepID=A0A512JDR7_9HYPH|nr:HlyD family type I secretion periplasmic adaptor subunit [Methylobacterium oxalidis]GEP08090.1 RsaA secretion system, membrane protein RsaE [Methylobacterium oxalidis]GJE35111.1 Type I secretion system membrane fusion protein PrsE [Methylobacterium oxalidis]GLS64492.1 RsaA secretion system, membrane protein RsaE [Methylobacterium oxalidis]
MTTALTIQSPPIRTDWRRSVLLAYLVILIAFGGGAGWASLAKLESAAIASGVVMSQSNKKTVQHLEGGIVRAILVRDGDQVQEGQTLLRLDDTQARASLETTRSQQAIDRIREARLLAERDQTDRIVLPDSVTSRAHEPAIARAIQDEKGNLRERAVYLRSQTDVLNAKIVQTEQEVRALRNDADSTKQQLVTIDQELSGLRQLLAKQLVPVSRVAALERERIRLQGALDRAISDAKKGEQAIDETRLTIIQTQKQFLQQVSSDIIDVRKSLAELLEKENVAKDVLSRVEVRAPRTGIVQSMKVFTIGAVLRPGDTMLEIAPTGDQLTVGIQISPADVDSVAEGLRAEVRFPTYHSRRVPIMLGQVRSVSYDRVTDPQNPQNSYFQGEVVVDAASVPTEIKDRLKPGMPADVIVTTGEQTPLDYFLSPLFDRVSHGLREK